jgi:hypothetical protein
MRRFTLFVAVTSALVLLGPLPSAHAQEVTTFTGQGTDNGACNNFEEGEVPDGRQIFQFNLQPTANPASALLTASFSDGTSVTDMAPTSQQGATAHWLVETDLDATVLSASATHEPHQSDNAQLVVSHCVRGEPNGEPPNGEPPNGEPPNGEPPNGEPPNGQPPDGEPRAEQPPAEQPPAAPTDSPPPAPVTPDAAPVTPGTSPTPAPPVSPAAEPVTGQPAFTG